MKLYKEYQRAADAHHNHNYTKSGARKAILSHEMKAWTKKNNELVIKMRTAYAAYKASK
tara:strand:- start:1900 stop:2076 length:177 start_codon:yes stop_codon:yes gene_type:complete